MPIPFNTTTVTVTRSSAASQIDVDGWDAPEPDPLPLPVVSGLRAVVSTPSATTTLAGGDRIVFRATMRCDPADVQPNDVVTDNLTGQVWYVLNVVPQQFAFDFLIVQMVDSQGAAVV